MMDSTEAANMEAVNTEAANMEAVNTEAANTEAMNTEAANAEAVNTEAANAEAVNSEAANTEAVNTEDANTEAVNTEAGKTASLKERSKSRVNDAMKFAGSALSMYHDREAPDILAERTKETARVAASKARDKLQYIAGTTKHKAQNIAEDERAALVLKYARKVTRQGGNIGRYGRSKVIEMSEKIFGKEGDDDDEKATTTQRDSKMFQDETDLDEENRKISFISHESSPFRSLPEQHPQSVPDIIPIDDRISESPRRPTIISPIPSVRGSTIIPAPETQSPIPYNNIIQPLPFQAQQSSPPNTQTQTPLQPHKQKPSIRNQPPSPDTYYYYDSPHIVPTTKPPPPSLPLPPHNNIIIQPHLPPQPPPHQYIVYDDSTRCYDHNPPISTVVNRAQAPSVVCDELTMTRNVMVADECCVCCSKPYQCSPRCNVERKFYRLLIRLMLQQELSQSKMNSRCVR